MSNIEWTDTTWNPVIGCTPVSPGCLNCYAAGMARRLEAMGKPQYAPRHPSAEEQAARHAAGVTTPPSIDKAIRIAEVRGGRAVFTGEVRTLPDRLAEPLSWKKPRRIFVNSMSDLFHETVPFEFIDRVFAVMALCPQHTFQVLTKRPERMAEYLDHSQRQPNPHSIDQINPCSTVECIDVERDCVDIPGQFPGDHWANKARMAEMPWPLPNVWLGTSVENQAHLKRVWATLHCPAQVRFVSAEPLLGPLDFEPIEDLFRNIRPGPTMGICLNWVIVGGESGPNARPCNVEWIRAIVKQCRDAGVPVFVKQVGAKPYEDAANGNTVRSWGDARIQKNGDYVQIHLKDRKGGDPAEWPEDLRVREWPHP